MRDRVELTSAQPFGFLWRQNGAGKQRPCAGSRPTSRYPAGCDTVLGWTRQTNGSANTRTPRSGAPGRRPGPELKGWGEPYVHLRPYSGSARRDRERRRELSSCTRLRSAGAEKAEARVEAQSGCMRRRRQSTVDEQQPATLVLLDRADHRRGTRMPVTCCGDRLSTPTQYLSSVPDPPVLTWRRRQTS